MPFKGDILLLDGHTRAFKRGLAPVPRTMPEIRRAAGARFAEMLLARVPSELRARGHTHIAAPIASRNPDPSAATVASAVGGRSRLAESAFAAIYVAGAVSIFARQI